MTVADALEKIKSIDRDIKSINWVEEQINIRPNDEDFSHHAWKVLENELEKLKKEKETIMNYFVKDYQSETVLEVDKVIDMINAEKLEICKRLYAAEHCQFKECDNDCFKCILERYTELNRVGTTK